MPPRLRKRPVSRGASSSRNVRSKNARAPTPSPTPSPSHSSSSSSSSRSPPRHNLPWPLLNIEFHDRFDKMLERVLIPTRYLDDDLLRGIGLYDEIMVFARHMGWDEFMRRKHPTYRELTFEFLSTFKTDYNPPNDDDILRVSFQCMGVQHTCTLAEFSQLLGLPAEGEQYMGPTFIAEEAWIDLTGKVGYNASQSKSSQLRNPSLRILHRFMVHSLFGKGESHGVVTKGELYFLHCMVRRRRLYTAVWFIKHLNHICFHSTGKIAVGGLITSIAHSLGFRYMEGRDTLVAGNARVDRNTLQHMGMCKIMSGNQVWLLDVDGNPVRPMRPVEPAERDDEPEDLDDAAEQRDGGAQPDIPPPQPQRDIPGPSTSSAPSFFHSTAGWTIDSLATAIMGRMDVMDRRMDQIQSEIAEMRGEVRQLAETSSDDES